MLLFVGIYFIFKGVHNVGRGGSEKIVKHIFAECGRE